jgi:hypothetical protein
MRIAVERNVNNTPHIVIYGLPEMPGFGGVIYETHEILDTRRPGTLYVGERPDGFVHFMLHRPTDETGYGGAVIPVQTKAGAFTIKGPWSSRAGVVNAYRQRQADAGQRACPDPVIEVLIVEPKYGYKQHGYAMRVQTLIDLGVVFRAEHVDALGVRIPDAEPTYRPVMVGRPSPTPWAPFTLGALLDHKRTVKK